MLCSLWTYLEGGNCKGCRGKKVRFREIVGVWCASRSLDRIKQHTDFICICEIIELYFSLLLISLVVMWHYATFCSQYNPQD